MSSTKPKYNLSNCNDLLEAENKVAKEKRDLLTSLGHNCLTCAHTKTRAGVWLLCEVKSLKKVTQYNLCERHSHIAELKLLEASQDLPVGVN